MVKNTLIKGSSEALPEGFSSIEEGCSTLAREFHWMPNKCSSIRGAALLEPMNKLAVGNFLDKFLSILSSSLDIEGNPLSSVKLIDIPLSEIQKQYPNHGKKFLSAFLKEYYSDFRNGVLLIRTDTVNIEAEEMGKFTLAVVENEPEPNLQEFCATQNVRLLFLFDEHDTNKYKIQGKSGETMRLMEPTVQMIDTSQIKDPEIFIKTRRVTHEISEQWRRQISDIFKTWRIMDN